MTAFNGQWFTTRHALLDIPSFSLQY